MADRATFELWVLQHGSPEVIDQYRKMSAAAKEFERSASQANNTSNRRGPGNNSEVASFRREQRMQNAFMGMAGLGGSQLDAVISRFEYLQFMAGRMNMSVGAMLAQFGPMAAVVAAVGVGWGIVGKQVDQARQAILEFGIGTRNAQGEMEQVSKPRWWAWALLGDTVAPLPVDQGYKNELARNQQAQLLARVQAAQKDTPERRTLDWLHSLPPGTKTAANDVKAFLENEQFRAKFDEVNQLKNQPWEREAATPQGMLEAYRSRRQAARDQGEMLSSNRQWADPSVRTAILTDYERNIKGVADLRNRLAGSASGLESDILSKTREFAPSKVGELLEARVVDMVKRFGGGSEQALGAKREFDLFGFQKRKDALERESAWINSDRSAPNAVAGSHAAALAGFRAQTEVALKDQLAKRQTELQTDMEKWLRDSKDTLAQIYTLMANQELN